MSINGRMTYSDNRMLLSNKIDECSNMGGSSNPFWVKTVWNKIVPYESIHKRSKERQNPLWWYQPESVCLGYGVTFLQKHRDTVSRVFSRMTEISVLYPVLGGCYMGIYSNISTSLRFKQYASSYFECGVTTGPKDTFSNEL